MKIGEMAELGCVSVKTLRHYETKDVLRPAWVDSESGYRYYSTQQCSMLDSIIRLKALGMPLNQIRRLIDDGDIDELARSAQERLNAIRRQQRELLVNQYAAQRLLDSVEAVRHKDEVLGVLRLEEVPARRVLKFALSECPGLSEDELWERLYHEVKSNLIEHGYPLALYGNVGCIVSKELLDSGLLKYDHAYVFIDDEFCDLFEETSMLPGGTHLVLEVEAGAPEDEAGATSELGGVERMLAYAHEHGYQVCGDYFDVSLAEGPLYRYPGRGCLLEQHLPVRLPGK